MHELTVIENIARISTRIAEENAIKSIKAIHLDIGSMQHVNEEIMTHGFDAIKEGTLFASAELVFHRLEVQLKCNACQKLFLPEKGKFTCPYCGDPDTCVVQGMELRINRIEGE